MAVKLRKFRNWLSDKCYEAARSLEDLAGWLYVPHSSFKGGISSELITTVLRNRSAKLAEDVMRHNAILRSLAEKRDG